MAAYFHGAPEIQQDGLQTLYLMNPSYDGYADTATPANMVYLNSVANSLNPMTMSHNLQSNQQHQQHLVGIPLQPMVLQAQDPIRPASVPASQQVTAVHGLAPRVHYNLWSPAPSNSPVDLQSTSPMYPRRPSAPQQGLSLSLSPQQSQYMSYKPEAEVPASLPEASASASASMISGGITGLQSGLMGSKFLKAAQLLLDEVVTVQNGTQVVSALKTHMKSSRESEDAIETDTSAKRGADLPIAERQELQMKKSKLVGMLDEVEQRYRHYRHQMEIVVSSFEAVAGFGSARTYTSLALQTISKRFQCLRDAITGQIRTASKSLGEEVKSTGSRLRFVDHQLRQQRALQQLGMIQHNAWRPQRGLPERAVSVLRAWLFEHFLHPYPKDADKHMLAKQTGLTRSQVSNWFINARVRLWKPMVEEMYMEEFKEQELNNADDKASPSETNEESASRSGAHQERSPTRTEQTDSPNTPNGPRAPSMNPITIASTMPDNIMQPSLKRTRCEQPVSVELKPEMSDRDFLMKFMEAGSRGDNSHPLIASATNNNVGGFSTYAFDHEQFAPRFSGNGVSLTLGLPHSDNLSLPGSQPPYLPTDNIPMGRRLDNSNDYCSLGNNPTTTTNHPPNPYESINIQNGKRFATMLLPDFIA